MADCRVSFLRLTSWVIPSELSQLTDPFRGLLILPAFDWFSIVCLLAVAFQTLENAPVLVLANREESYSRPSTPPQLQQPKRGELPWVGGLDLLAGGTWLGVNAQGLLVAVTNRRRLHIPPRPRSRGLLCRDLLAASSAEQAHERATAALRSDQYAGCNFLLVDRSAGWVIEATDSVIEHPLEPGLQLVTNGILNDPDDVRIARVRRELAAANPKSLVDWQIAGERICGERANGTEPAICLEGREGGTVSASLIAYGNEPDAAIYHHAAGSPATTPFSDYSILLQSLLKGDGHTGNSRSPHRIALRGPWEYETLTEAKSALSASGKVRLPDEWSALFGAYRGRIRWKRRFHRPTNLSPTDRVDLVFNGVGGRGTVQLNGQRLGELTDAPPAQAFDITPFLRGEEDLVVELEFTDGEKPGGLFGPVVLEIHSNE